ncbi:lipopolysaccharide biosynthesis protein [Paenibacillus sp. MMO-177]|uniref:lipopolysaccharide biosynthesis protein n=1 Tax=Paenibacillus sp. MMO-177 TaxID=3081289 RepID=UPI003018B4E6
MREKLAMRNTTVTLLCQISDTVLQFITRKLFILYIGIELLGANSTFISILGALSLAELGFESAVIYSLYKPIAENKKDVVEDIIVILKRVYTIVGVFVIISGFVCVPLLPYILKGIEVTSEIYLAFIIQVLSTAITYFMAHRRTLLYALKMDFIRNLYISGYKLIAAIFQIIILLNFSSFIGFVLVVFIQNILTNFSISRYVKKRYDYNFKGRKFNKKYYQNILKNVKDIFWGRIAGYIYFSTDSLVISTVVGATAVGYLSNYMQIFIQLKTVLSNVLNSNRPIIGDLLSQSDNKEHTLRVLHNYTFIRYILCSVCLVPGALLIDNFISLWLSPLFILPFYITIFIVADLFITIVHGALVDYISGLGYFSHDKKISIAGALINLITSIIMVNFYGVAGVLSGTIISQAFFWIARSIIVFKYYYSDTRIQLYRYWRRQFIYIMLFSLNIILGFYVNKLISLDNLYLRFIIGGLISLVIVGFVNIAVFHRSAEYRYIREVFERVIAKLIVRKKKEFMSSN